MKYFLNKKWELLIVILVIFLASFIYYNKSTFSQKPSILIPISKPVVVDTSIKDVKIENPIRLKIPVIGVDAEIEYVGLTANGEMDVPKNAANVAWFKLGTFPGEEGSAVIAGHFDDKNGEEAVFYDLQDLNKGDQIFIENSQGEFIVFIVRETRVYDSEDFAPEVFTSSKGKHLNLITCTGSWSKSQKRYEQRFIVFTEMILE